MTSAGREKGIREERKWRNKKNMNGERKVKGRGGEERGSVK